MAINPEVVSPKVKLNVTNVKSIFNGGGKGGALFSNRGGSLVKNIGSSLSVDRVFELNNNDSLEQRVANNEKKITMLKRIVKVHQTPFGGGPLEEVQRILEDIGNALALDFSNRITQRQDEITNLREGAETKRRGGIESGLETVNKISKKVNSAFGAVVAPATGILNKILGFFGSLAAGFVADKALTWLSNNKEAVTGFFQFLQDHGKKILIALGVFIGGVIAVKVVQTIMAVAKFIKGAIFVIKKALQIARILIKMGPKALKPLGKIALGQGLKLGGKQTSKIVAKQVTKQAITKGATKTLLKKIPLVGLGLGAAFAIGRAAKGDWVGAGMELSSGAASMIPGAGTAASVGIDAALMYKDIKSAGNLEPPETGSSVEIMQTIRQSDMSNLGGQSGGGVENSLPMTSATDNSNGEIEYTLEQLGIY